MNRRGFLKLAASLLPLPAFVQASSLWLPPERLFIPPPETGLTFETLRAAMLSVARRSPVSDMIISGRCFNELARDLGKPELATAECGVVYYLSTKGEMQRVEVRRTPYCRDDRIIAGSAKPGGLLVEMAFDRA